MSSHVRWVHFCDISHICDTISTWCLGLLEVSELSFGVFLSREKHGWLTMIKHQHLVVQTISYQPIQLDQISFWKQMIFLVGTLVFRHLSNTKQSFETGLVLVEKRRDPDPRWNSSRNSPNFWLLVLFDLGRDFKQTWMGQVLVILHEYGKLSVVYVKLMVMMFTMSNKQMIAHPRGDRGEHQWSVGDLLRESTRGGSSVCPVCPATRRVGQTPRPHTWYEMPVRLLKYVVTMCLEEREILWFICSN